MSMSFPFGQPVQRVRQRERTPKRVFILGVYASAVHAIWLNEEGRVLVRALAVASEPYIFWRGDRADEIISGINMPDRAGRLLAAPASLNGPTGQSLDRDFIAPLSAGKRALTREDVWLCDLVPHSCMNPGQRKALEREYYPLAKELGLPTATLPEVPSILADDSRRKEIQEELEESCAEVLVLLGDQPIRWFLNAFHPNWKCLADFGTTPNEYGRLHPMNIGRRSMQVLPVCHPRQAAGLGFHSTRWRELHSHWKSGDSRYLSTSPRLNRPG